MRIAEGRWPRCTTHLLRCQVPTVGPGPGGGMTDWLPGEPKPKRLRSCLVRAEESCPS